ncbi:hypothetical protein, conserved [Plasmodium gonderi]|uniref:Uncharacterized protein n=1 Tax=Plasmodium gonderi TaxID=77519 RepID=A0A1Y1JC12_PLAGO|nr:hypothetical protein, conserved [Plasmodium gonderi]GAW78905.1 hypothetical protein, conserved [Plasmodium gonderi]
MIKRISCVGTSTKKGSVNPKVSRQKNTILKALIEKVTKIKEKNKFFNCIPYYDYLFGKYSSFISIEDSFALFYLQNKDGFFSKKLMQHICSIISNASIHCLLKLEIKYIINHLYECNIYKYKCFFQNEYYYFIHNSLLLCCLQLCTPSVFEEKLNEEEQKKIRLKNLHKFCDARRDHLIQYDRENQSEKFIFCDMHFLSKVYKCFIVNNIHPFPFFNKYIYLYLCKHVSRPHSKCITFSLLYKESSFASVPKKYLFNGKSCNLSTIHEIIKMLFYLSKGDLHFYYESFIKAYFYIILDYLHRLNDAPIENSLESYLKTKNNISQKEEENIDNLIVSIVNFLSSSYIMKNIERKIPVIMLCAYTSLVLFKILYKRHFSYINWSSYDSVPLEHIKTHHFILVAQRSKSHLFRLSFIKKCSLLVYIINDLIQNMPEQFAQKYSKFSEEMSNISKICSNNEQFDICMQMIKIMNNYTIYRNIYLTKDACSDDILKSINIILTKLYTKKNFNFLNYAYYPFLKILHYYTFLPYQGNKNDMNWNHKRSELEKEIFYFLQHYLRKRFPNFAYACDENIHTLFFTIDIQIRKITK